jgi:biotin transport system permease protein
VSPTAPGGITLGMYVPGLSWLHRTPVGVKLAGLVTLGLVLLLAPAPWTWATGSLALVAVVLAALSSRLPLGDLLRSLRGVLLVALAAGGYQWWRSGWETAVGVATTLLALVLAGLVVTMTTPMDAMIDVVVRLARPLRHVGLPPEWVALAVALTLRGVPTLVLVAQQSLEAARARGLERNPRAVLVPTVVRTVAPARRTGEALAARGLPD